MSFKQLDKLDKSHLYFKVLVYEAFYFLFLDQQFVSKASCKLPMDIGFEKAATSEAALRFVVIVRKTN